jgi:hypothetical protein
MTKRVQTADQTAAERSQTSVFFHRREFMNEELSAVQRKILVELQSFIAKHG